MLNDWWRDQREEAHGVALNFVKRNLLDAKCLECFHVGPNMLSNMLSKKTGTRVGVLRCPCQSDCCATLSWLLKTDLLRRKSCRHSSIIRVAF